MPKRPDNYVAIQKQWSSGSSPSYAASARDRVKRAVKEVRAFGLKQERVVVIGPQNGYELLEFQEQGISPLVGVDVVPLHCERCRAMGFTVVEDVAENLQAAVEGQWNIYASHSLEHCYDLPRAVEQIESVCDQWCFFDVPIEPTHDDPAHFSAIPSIEAFKLLFPSDRWRELYMEFTVSEKGNGQGNLQLLLVRAGT